jgi:hypothetical protein
MYESRIMKPIKTIKRGEGKERVIEGVDMIKIHYMHEWKYHNKTPLINT